MNSWDIDPNLYLPLFRTIFRSLRTSLRHLLASPARARSLRAAPPAGCRS
jgi:hypothetical protein